MKNAKLLTLSCLLTALVAPVSGSCEEFLLYSPSPATGDQLPASPDQGVLVKKVTVKSGDTLSHLSRRHIGRASWFPQLLVFNSIKNPDLIYPGDRLLVPVPAGHKAAAKKHAKGTKGRRHHAARQPALASHAVEQPKAANVQPARSDEQQSYQLAKRAYLAGEYQKAQDLFTAFLRKFPNSSLAPDASLYQADCLLHLAGQ